MERWTSVYLFLHGSMEGEEQTEKALESNLLGQNKLKEPHKLWAMTSQVWSRVVNSPGSGGGGSLPGTLREQPFLFVVSTHRLKHHGLKIF